MHSFEALRTLVERRVGEWADALPADGLYGPMAYLMRLPAKRVRPVATLMACELFGGNAEDVLDEALGIELFHNFTLMHDDIMDEAPLRRGRPSVHVKWNVNTAILSGDAMLVKAVQLMARDPGISAEFSRHALLVCEGQMLDMAFERREEVGLAEYMEMIRLKTAVLLSCALRVGAMKGGASEDDRERLGSFGEYLGIAFQLRDDLLDAFGDPEAVGKQRGGDLRAGKKTWLLIRGLEHSREEGREELARELARAPAERNVPAMLAVLEALGVRREAEAEVARFDRMAGEALDEIAVPGESSAALRTMLELLRSRVH